MSWGEDYSGGAAAMDELSDADTSGADAPTLNDVLTWDGSNWVPKPKGEDHIPLMDSGALVSF